MQALENSVSKSQSAHLQLVTAFEQSPWVAASLFHALDMAKVPPSIWGTSPPRQSPSAILHSALYTLQGLDLWKANEARDLLKIAGSQAKPSEETIYADERPISQDEARHIILADKPSLIALLPRELTKQIGSASDPLPPENEIKSYDTEVSDGHRPSSIADPYELVQNRPGAFIQELGELHRVFGMLIPGFNQRLEGQGATEAPIALSEADMARATEFSNLPPQALLALSERLHLLRRVLSEQPNRTITSPEHGEASLTQEGVIQIQNLDSVMEAARHSLAELRSSASDLDDGEDGDM